MISRYVVAKTLPHRLSSTHIRPCFDTLYRNFSESKKKECFESEKLRQNNESCSSSLSRGIFHNTSGTADVLDDDDESNDRFLKSRKVVVGPSSRAIFPWRHSPYSLPRLISDTDEYFEQGGHLGPSMPYLPPFVQKILFIQAAGMINIPLWKIMLGRQMWEEELAYGFRKAFELSVAGILAETYHVPFHQVLKEDIIDENLENINEDSENEESMPYPVDFNYTFDPSHLETDDITEDTKSSEERVEEENEEKNEEEDEEQNEEDIDEVPESQYMMESDLRGLYYSAHEQAKSKLRIRLSTEAVSARVKSMFSVPFLTREDIKRNPTMQRSFHNIYSTIKEKEQTEHRKLGYSEIFMDVVAGLEKMATRQINTHSGMMESTVIAQVEIQCREIFSVTDIETNKVIQGDEDEKANYVTHLVRFEMVCRINTDNSNAYGNRFEMGSWQITDWDDLLGGNIWYI